MYFEDLQGKRDNGRSQMSGELLNDNSTQPMGQPIATNKGIVETHASNIQMSCLTSRGIPQVVLTPQNLALASTIHRILSQQNPKALKCVQQCVNVGEAVSTNSSMSSPSRPLDDELFDGMDEETLIRLLAGVTLSRDDDVSGIEQQDVTSVVGHGVQPSDDTSAGVQREAGDGGHQSLISRPMQSDIAPNVSVGSQSGRAEPPDDVGVSNTRGQFQFDVDEDMGDYFDAVEIDEAEIAGTPSANALAMQFQVAQLQLERQLLQQQLANERLQRQIDLQSHELFVFRQMQADESQSASLSPTADVDQVISQGVVQQSVHGQSMQNVVGVQSSQVINQPVIVPSVPVAEAGSSQPSLVPSTIKLERPSTFSGKHSELRNWMHEMKQYIESVNLGNYENACRFVVSYLKGAALTWWRMYAVEHQQAGSTSVFDNLDLDTLFDELETQFSDVDTDLRLRDKLLNLQQRGTVQEYTSQFKALQIELGPKRLDDDTAFHVYQAGLQRDIRLQVMLKDPQTLSDLQLYAERYARALKAFSDSGGYNKSNNNRGSQFQRGNFGQHRGGFHKYGNRGNFRGGFRNFGNNWGRNNNNHNPHSYQNVSQYNNSNYKGPAPMVLGMVQRGGMQKRGNSSSTFRGGFSGNCNYCGRFGHKANDCFKRQREMGNVKPNGGNDKGKNVQFANVLEHPSSDNSIQQPSINTMTIPQLAKNSTVGASSSWNPSIQPQASNLKQSKN